MLTTIGNVLIFYPEHERDPITNDWYSNELKLFVNLLMKERDQFNMIYVVSSAMPLMIESRLRRFLIEFRFEHEKPPYGAGYWFKEFKKQ